MEEHGEDEESQQQTAEYLYMIDITADVSQVLLLCIDYLRKRGEQSKPALILAIH